MARTPTPISLMTISQIKNRPCKVDERIEKTTTKQLPKLLTTTVVEKVERLKSSNVKIVN